VHASRREDPKNPWALAALAQVMPSPWWYLADATGTLEFPIRQQI